MSAGLQLSFVAGGEAPYQTENEGHDQKRNDFSFFFSMGVRGGKKYTP